MSRNRIWDILSAPPVGMIGTAAPGTGPAQADTTSIAGTSPRTTLPPDRKGSPAIPKTEPANQMGYGGQGDATVIVSPPTDVTSSRANMEQLARELQMRPPGPLAPRPNQLYDSIASREAWKDIVKATAHGTFTPGAGNTLNTNLVTLDQGSATFNPGLLRLDQFPRGTHAYLVINVFSFAPVATTMTGSLLWYFQAQTGSIPIYLGAYSAGIGTFQQVKMLIDAPVVDPGNNIVGTLFAQGNTIATAAAVTWCLDFGYVFLVPEPAGRGYEAVGQRVDQSRKAGGLWKEQAAAETDAITTGRH